MEEKNTARLVMLFVAVFVTFLVSIMSYSLWRDKQINAFLATNSAWGVQCDRNSRTAWVIRDGERVTLTVDNLTLYCSGYRFVARDESGKEIRRLDKNMAYQSLLRPPL
ncbi:hypothetical protein [Klebsiella sp. BIGb0407]|uniref:hypothetical protein n=1 Tax=Klebsiella sp. BIGb0407 TaxID=2940603 RepID=UPI00216751A3|nr:hypothetical protein [Klebsiella sp. BIGb0407]MCS3434236.1 hypothetical protein [Klebsiella sp. BIGb0407]